MDNCHIYFIQIILRQISLPTNQLKSLKDKERIVKFKCVVVHNQLIHLHTSMVGAKIYSLLSQ